MTARLLLACPLVAAVTLGFGASPAGADWLVLKDGSRVETRGQCRVDGRLVVFTGTDGKLSSLRSDDLDLAASRRVTEEAKSPIATTPTPPPPVRKAVRRLTNADIPQGRQPETGSADSTGGESAPASEAESQSATDRSSAAELIVVASEERSDPIGGHVVVTGTLANASSDMATAVRLTVRLFGPEGGVLAEREATLDRSALPPGEDTDFRAEFPSVFAAFAVTFQPSAVMLLSGAPPPTSADGPESPEASPEP